MAANLTPPLQPLRLLGLPARHGRWLLIPIGMTILMCLGNLYSWSVFRQPLEQELGISATASLLPYTIALVFNAAFVTITGFQMVRIGPRTIAVVGGLCVGGGYWLSSFATNIELITLTYGLIAGVGVGIVYGAPMVTVARWFPDRQGLAVGLTITGFGLSPLITAPLSKMLINQYGLRPTLQLLGISFTVIVIGLAMTLKLPPPEWPQLICHGSLVCLARAKVYPANPLKTQAFYGLWICYTIATIVGLSAIGISSPVGVEVIHLEPTVAANSLALFAVFNGLSRPLFGWLSDRYHPHHVAIGSFSLILMACLVMMTAHSGNVGQYLTAFCVFWFCLGGWLAIAPATTLQFFHPDSYAQTYGLLFSAYGVGALVGTLVTGQIRDWFGSYTYAFYPMAGLAIVGIIVAYTMLRPEHPNCASNI